MPEIGPTGGIMGLVSSVMASRSELPLAELFLRRPRLASSLIIRQTHVSFSVQKPQSTSTSSAVVRVDEALRLAAEGSDDTSKPGPDKTDGDVR